MDARSAWMLLVLTACGSSASQLPREAPDRDRDGVPDLEDRCIHEAENLNAFEDQDGCPDQPAGRPPASSTGGDAPAEKASVPVGRAVVKVGVLHASLEDKANLRSATTMGTHPPPAGKRWLMISLRFDRDGENAFIKNAELTVKDAGGTEYHAVAIGNLHLFDLFSGLNRSRGVVCGIPADTEKFDFALAALLDRDAGAPMIAFMGDWPAAKTVLLFEVSDQAKLSGLTLVAFDQSLPLEPGAGETTRAHVGGWGNGALWLK